MTEMADKAEKTAKPIDKKLQDSKANTREWIKDIGIALILALVFLQFITPTIVREHSMENTLQQNDYVFVSRRHYTWLKNDIQRGDIIVFRSDLTTAGGSEKLLVKRVIGLPGETVSISDGSVFINGEAIDAGYTKDGYTNTEMDEVYVPEGKLFCMGDNRQNSRDSRDSAIGLVDEDDVLGKAVFRLFPFSRIGGLY